MGKLLSKTQFLKKLWADGGKGLSYGSEKREGGWEQVRRRAKLCAQTESFRDVGPVELEKVRSAPCLVPAQPLTA